MKLDQSEIEGRVAIFAAHGTSVAAAWYSTSRVAMATWLRSHGHELTPGKPTPAALARRAPRAFCSCPMCVSVRVGEASDEFVDQLAVLLLPPAGGRPALELRREVWMTFGACRKLPEIQREWFFPPDSERRETRLRREAAAKSVCADCRVRKACADYALSNGEQYGIWGGLTESERGQQVHSIAV